MNSFRMVHDRVRGFEPLELHGCYGPSNDAPELDVTLKRVCYELLKLVQGNSSILCTKGFLDLTTIPPIVCVVHTTNFEDGTLVCLPFNVRHTWLLAMRFHGTTSIIIAWAMVEIQKRNVPGERSVRT